MEIYRLKNWLITTLSLSAVVILFTGILFSLSVMEKTTADMEVRNKWEAVYKESAVWYASSSDVSKDGNSTTFADGNLDVPVYASSSDGVVSLDTIFTVQKQLLVIDGDKEPITKAPSIVAQPADGMSMFIKTFVSRFKKPKVNHEVSKLQLILAFIVEKDGSLSNIRVLRDPGYGAGEEAVRVLTSMPKWKAAVQRNKTVRSNFVLPVTIMLR